MPRTRSGNRSPSTVPSVVPTSTAATFSSVPVIGARFGCCRGVSVQRERADRLRRLAILTLEQRKFRLQAGGDSVQFQQELPFARVHVQASGDLIGEAKRVAGQRGWAKAAQAGGFGS